MPNEQLTNKLAEIREFWNQPTFDIHKRFFGASTTAINSARVDIDLLQYQLQQTRDELKQMREDGRIMFQELEKVKAERDEIKDYFRIKQDQVWILAAQVESLRTELEHVKAERDKYREEATNERQLSEDIVGEREQLYLELEAKDKVLEDFANGSPYATKHKASSILSQYEVKHETSK